MTTFDVVLSEAVSSGASDVYFLEGVPPAIKVDGLVSPVAGADALDAAGMRAILERLLPVKERTAFAEAGEANLSHMHPILGRFRVNCYRAMGVSGAVLRRVKTEVPTLESLELPPLLGSLVLERQGLILLVGATGAGKSTTVAAMLHQRITRSRGHVVTIEDPVEFLHDSDQSIVSQREVGIDTESYLDRPPERAPAGPRRHLHRRAPGSRDGRGRATLRRDRPPRGVHPARDERDDGDRAPAQLLPARGPGLDAPPAVAHPAGGDRPASRPPGRGEGPGSPPPRSCWSRRASRR